MQRMGAGIYVTWCQEERIPEEKHKPIHAYIYHVPHIVQMHGSIKPFSGQALEKSMMTSNRFINKKSANGMLQKRHSLFRKRIEGMHREGKERKKRKYEKQSDWCSCGNMGSKKREKLDTCQF